MIKTIFIFPILMTVLFASFVPAEENDLTLQNSPALQQNQPQDIHDIYPPILLQAQFKWWFVILAAAAIAAAAAVVFFLLRKRKQGSAPEIPPHQTALADLTLARHFITDNQSLLYAERVSEILRIYIEKRFRIHSTRQTTTEFLASLNTSGASAEPGLIAYRSSLKEFLNQCDMAKYAHKKSAREHMEKMEEGVRSFIEQTIPEEKN